MNASSGGDRRHLPRLQPHPEFPALQAPKPSARPRIVYLTKRSPLPDLIQRVHTCPVRYSLGSWQKRDGPRGAR